MPYTERESDSKAARARFMDPRMVSSRDFGCEETPEGTSNPKTSAWEKREYSPIASRTAATLAAFFDQTETNMFSGKGEYP